MSHRKRAAGRPVRLGGPHSQLLMSVQDTVRPKTHLHAPAEHDTIAALLHES